MNKISLLKYSFTFGICGTAIYFSTKVKNVYYRMAVAGLLGQVTADFIFHPIDLVNTRTKYFYNQNLNTMTITKRIMSTTGIRGFFRGASVTVMGSSIAGFVYFYLYKRIKEYLKIRLEKHQDIYFVAYTISSFISEILVYSVYYPFDLIKTRIQTGQYQYNNFFDGVRKIWDNSNKIESIKNLYSGFIPSVILSTSTITLTFFSFEICRDYFAGIKNIQSSEVSGLDYFKCCLISGIVTSCSLNFLEVFTIQKIVHGKEFTFKIFLKPKNFMKALTSGLLARNVYGIFYTIFILELVKFFGKIYEVSF